MNDSDVCEAIGIDKKKLAAWRRMGLPHSGRGRGRSYEESDVRDWLIATGLAKPAEYIRSIDGIAKRFDVSHRTIFVWRQKGMPKAQNGYYDAVAIDDWLQRGGLGPYSKTGPKASGGGSGGENGNGNGNGHSSTISKAEADARVSLERAEKLAMENAKRRGELVLLEPMLDRVRRRLNELRAIINQLPEKIGAKVVELGLPPENLGAVIADCREVIDTGWDAAADLCEREDADERDESEPEIEPEAEGE